MASSPKKSESALLAGFRLRLSRPSATPIEMDKSPSLSPGSSPLSMHDSDAAFEAEYLDEARGPPSKRPRLDPTPAEAELDFDNLSISSDTSGDVPQSPNLAHPEDDEPHREQVTICQWEGCTGGDMGNMDKLVEHIHNEHIEGRQKKYTCEWDDCSRKSMPHASAYALKAHMRSHTREKPFYCALPECDRSFTRSDALAKHMRTVHETEALRPSDPVPKSMQPQLKPGARLKLIIKQQSDYTDGSGLSSGHTRDAPADFNSPSNSEHEPLTPFQPEAIFTPEELAMDPKEFFRLLRRQVHWAEEESESLQRECEYFEAIRKKEFVEKELLLDQVIKNEIDWHERRKMVLATLPSADELRAQAMSRMDTATGTATGSLAGDTETEAPREGEQDAAAVLAGMSQA